MKYSVTTLNIQKGNGTRTKNDISYCFGMKSDSKKKFSAYATEIPIVIKS